MDDESKKLKGHPLAIDPTAESARPGGPAFAAKPPGAPVYYGFPILQGAPVDGFHFGMITDFLSEPGASEGDAFVVAPDGSRAGLVWEISEDDRFREVCPMEEQRWGVWDVTFRFPMTTPEDAKRNLRAILPHLREKWMEWKERFNK